MRVTDHKMPLMDHATIEERRLNLLDTLASEVHPLAIFQNLQQSQSAVFIISDPAARVIRQGLADPYRRFNESSALATVTIAARTPDKTGIVYQVDTFQFENLGTADGVLSIARDRLNAGEIEVHSHLFTSPDYLGKTDVGDLIAAVEGPAWVDPQTRQVNPALRIFGILSIYPDHIASLQFYKHDLRDHLHATNNYGLKTLGKPILLPDAY